MAVQTEYNYFPMFYTGASDRPRSVGARAFAAALASSLLTCFSLANASADGIPGPSSCDEDAACIIVEYEEPVASEAVQLADTLRLRLTPYGVRVVAEEAGGERGEKEDFAERESRDPARPKLLWIVHLRSLSRGILLVAVDNFVSSGAEDMVREVVRRGSEESIVWTMALMIEEIVTPYFVKSADTPALGAGLAIIEPPAVGGISAREEERHRQYPRFRAIDVGLLMLGVVSADALALGPSVAVEGMLAPRFLASLSLGWAGVPDFFGEGVRGRVQFVPLDLDLGYAIYHGNAIELSAWTGLTMGFAVYSAESSSGADPQRTDVLFEPGARASLRVSFALAGPLFGYVRGGVMVPFVHDEIENRGAAVYEASWIVPSFEVGLQFKLRNF